MISFSWLLRVNRDSAHHKLSDRGRLKMLHWIFLMTAYILSRQVVMTTLSECQVSCCYYPYCNTFAVSALYYCNWMWFLMSLHVLWRLFAFFVQILPFFPLFFKLSMNKHEPDNTAHRKFFNPFGQTIVGHNFVPVVICSLNRMFLQLFICFQ